MYVILLQTISKIRCRLYKRSPSLIIHSQRSIGMYLCTTVPLGSRIIYIATYICRHSSVYSLLSTQYSVQYRRQYTVHTYIAYNMIAQLHAVCLYFLYFKKTEGLELGAVDKLLVGIFVVCDGREGNSCVHTLSRPSYLFQHCYPITMYHDIFISNRIIVDSFVPILDYHIEDLLTSSIL